MKKIMMLCAAAIAVCGLYSCAGHIDPNDDNNGGTDLPDSGYTISVDKTTLEADGVSVVTFSLLTPDGKDLTKDSNTKGGCYFQIVETGEYLDRLQTTFSAFENGTYTFSGMYEGIKTENTVTVQAVNRSKYEKYHRNVAVYKLTGTWCGNCPTLTAALHALPEDIQSHIVTLCVHGSSSSVTDPFALSVGSGVDMGNYMLSQFGSLGFPTLVMNLNSVSTNPPRNEIEQMVNAQRRDYPATCGIKVTSKVENGGLKAEVSLASDKGGTYDLECAVLLDNQVYAAGEEPGGNYSNILRGYSGNFIQFSTSFGREVAPGREISKTMEVDRTVVPELATEPENCRIVVYAFRRLDDGSTIVDNIVSCPVNGSIDYVLNAD